MATNLLWFVMAGFLLGFATSTLWEWFYFRKERLKLTDRRIRELEAKLRDAEAEADSTTPTSTGTETTVKGTLPTVAAVTRERTRTSAWGDPAYRSPGVFLESEDFAADDARDDLRSERYSDEADVPTVDSVSSKTSPAKPVSTTQAAPGPISPYAPKSQPVTPVDPPVDEVMPRPIEPRAELPTPADALRAKRGTTGRSRQEVLAALRRNSEAVQRGEYPPPEPPRETANVPGMRPKTLVSPFDPDDTAVDTPLDAPEADDVAHAAPEAAAPALSPARLRWSNDAKLTMRTKDFPDDLSKIRGIGDVYKQRLYRAGIYTWKQIAETDIETLRRATSAYPSSNVDEWLTQAQALMQKHGRSDAVYNGPPPDDMTKILGIGPVSASVLYRAGICTYEQLASTPKQELEALFPVAVAGDMPDFDQWIERATLLADEKHRDR